MPSQNRAEKYGVKEGPLADYLNKMTDTDGNSLENWWKNTYADSRLVGFAKLLGEVDEKLRKDEKRDKGIHDRDTELRLSVALTKHHSKGLEPKIIVQGGKLEIRDKPQK